MYCRICGKLIPDGSSECPVCGASQSGNGQSQSADNALENIIGIVGFVLAFIMPVAGLVCSIIGYKRAKEEGLPYKDLSLAGIVISAIAIGIAVLVLIIVIVTTVAALAIAV